MKSMNFALWSDPYEKVIKNLELEGQTYFIRSHQFKKDKYEIIILKTPRLWFDMRNVQSGKKNEIKMSTKLYALTSSDNTV